MKRAQLTAAKHAARHSRIAHLLRTICPYCHAPAGEPCRSKSGTPIWDIGQMHGARLTLRSVIEVNYRRICVASHSVLNSRPGS